MEIKKEKPATSQNRSRKADMRTDCRWSRSVYACLDFAPWDGRCFGETKERMLL